MAIQGTPGARRYSFEKYRPLHLCRLDARKADNDAEALLERLGQQAPEGGYSTHPFFQTLRDYCGEVTLNIDWYEERRQMAEKEWKKIFYRVIAAGTVTASLAVVVSQWAASEVALTLFLAAFLPALQGLASGIDHKSRMGGFWKASADLKELLFRLEEAWRGKDLEKDKVAYHVDGGVDVERTFTEVLKLDRMTARQICRAERESFFNTFKSPAEVVSKFSESIASLRKPEEAPEKKEEAESTGAPPEQAPASPELATHLKASAQGLTQVLQDIQDPQKRTDAIATALKLVQGLSKELDKPGSR
ncbi:MAG: hypothetical protein JXB05_27740 [Myxococcaceae bacterium]|nr:hypothetical protein [Myxococcaceae bacterium]